MLIPDLLPFFHENADFIVCYSLMAVTTLNAVELTLFFDLFELSFGEFTVVFLPLKRKEEVPIAVVFAMDCYTQDVVSIFDDALKLTEQLHDHGHFEIGAF